MSILSGILSGGELAAELGRAAIDASHYPFKRSKKRPGGPAGREDEAVQKWSCEWDNPVEKDGKKYTVQICTNNETGKTKKVKVNKAYKKLYNKRYRAGSFPKGNAFKRTTKRPGAKYRPPSDKWLRSRSR